MNPQPLAPYQIGLIARALDQHQRYRFAAYHTPPQTFWKRYNFRKRENWSVDFQTITGDRFHYQSEVGCSEYCVWYSGHFTINGQRSNAKAFREMLKIG